MSAQDPADRILELASRTGVIHARDLSQLGLPHEYLRRLTERGSLTKIGRGMYTPAAAGVRSINHGLAVMSKAVPDGEICLLSALRFHGIGTQLPHEVWMALQRPSRVPTSTPIRTRFFLFSETAFKAGRERHVIDGIEVSITSPAKTVADCFKFRNQVGMDVALEALRETLRLKKATVDELWKQARHCRVWKVMRPYIEAMA